MVERRFLVASSIARLLRREHPEFTRFIEGYFPFRRDRTQLVRVEQDKCFLVLRSTGPTGLPTEERHDIPLSQAEALMDVAAGRIAYDRTDLPFGPDVTATLDRFILPKLDVLTVAFASGSREFVSPPWLGQEVTDDPAFEATQLALHEPPSLPDLQITNEGIEALLDWVEDPNHTALASPSAAADEPGYVKPPASQSNARYAVFRNESRDPVDDGVVRLARSLAPRRSPGE